MRLSARLRPGQYDAAFSQYYRFAEQRSESAALIAIDRGTKMAIANIRTAMQAAGLGRLGQGIGARADTDVHHRGGGGFSVSGAFFIRSGSRRTRGAIESYTEGAEIRPVRGRWLWIATDQIPRIAAGRQRMTPELYRQSGQEAKIGPLVFVRSVNGNPLLVVKTASVSATGRSRSAKSLTKRGVPRKGQIAKEFIVAFIGIPRTSRAARIDVRGIMQSVSDHLPELYFQAIGRL